MALGFLAGLSVAVRLGRRSGLPAEPLTNLAVYVALAGLAGAKILMIAFDWGENTAKTSARFFLSQHYKQPVSTRVD